MGTSLLHIIHRIAPSWLMNQQSPIFLYEDYPITLSKIALCPARIFDIAMASKNNGFPFLKSMIYDYLVFLKTGHSVKNNLEVNIDYYSVEYTS
jgi:hypothetical protein